MEISGAEALIKSLIHEGVEVIFGYPGGAIMPAYDALYSYQDKIKHVLVRHEQGAAHAAEGYAAISGKVGACIVTSGPGATNTVTGIADAMLDSIPIVCITGQVASALLGTDAFQEVDIVGITTPITKWNYQITDAKEIPEVIAKAFYIAKSGRPGPVLIDITKDAQFGKLNFKYPKATKIATYKPVSEPKDSQMQKAAELINAAKKPLILAGHGVTIAHAEDELKKLAEMANIPVTSTLLGLSAFPTDHELYAGFLGMHGNYGPNKLTNQADLIIAIGMRFDDRVTGKLNAYAPNAKIIHIDIDQAEINKNVKVALSIVADAASALAGINKYIVKGEHKDWREDFHKHYKIEFDVVIEHDIHPQSAELTMAEIINELSDTAKADSIIVADVGQHQMKTARYYKFKKARTFVTSGGAGTMGFALPAGIGAKFAAKDTDVFVVVGDGSFQMNIQELGTISQEKIPVKIIILNNGFLGMVRQWQEMFFDGRYSFTPMLSPDFVKVAGAYGIKAKSVSTRIEMKTAIKELVKSKESMLVEFKVSKEENVFPMVPANASIDDIRLS